MLELVKLVLAFPNTIYNFIVLTYSNVNIVGQPSVNGRLKISGKGNLTFKENVKINSSHSSNPVGNASKTSFYIFSGAAVSVGSNVGISNTLFYAQNSIIIEDDVLIGGGCQLLDTDFHSLSYEDRILLGDNNVKTGPIVIGKGAFIGTCVTILKGVTVGTESIIAAGAVVTKNIPEKEIWGGNPARYIRKL